MDTLSERQVRGRWITAGSADRNLGLLRPGELTQLRGFGTVRYADAGTVVAASGSKVTQVQVVSTGELDLRARLDEGRATMAVVRTGGIIADIPLLLNAPDALRRDLQSGHRIDPLTNGEHFTREDHPAAAINELLPPRQALHPEEHA